VIRYFCRFT